MLHAEIKKQLKHKFEALTAPHFMHLEWKEEPEGNFLVDVFVIFHPKYQKDNLNWKLKAMSNTDGLVMQEQK